MEVELVEKGEDLIFVARENRIEVARMYCSRSANGALIINHTEVHNNAKGTGAGKRFVFYVVDYARKKKLTIVPVCRFSKNVFDRNPDLQDVL